MGSRKQTFKSDFSVTGNAKQRPQPNLSNLDIDDDEEDEDPDYLYMSDDSEDWNKTLDAPQYVKDRKPTAGGTENAIEYKNDSANGKNDLIVKEIDPQLKTEMTSVVLSNESRKRIMKTLKFLYGQDFTLQDRSNYRNKQKAVNSRYWMEPNKLMVQSIMNFSNKKVAEKTNETNMAALEKLERYGYYPNHCCEVLKKTGQDADKALEALFYIYFSVSRTNSKLVSKENEDLKCQELVALKSIYYENICEERIPNKLWIFHLELSYLTEWYVKKYEQKTLNKFPIGHQNRNRGRKICRFYASGVNCRFGNNCRFLHENPDSPNSHHKSYEDKEKMQFDLEIRFSEGLNYPEEVPIISFVPMYRNFSKYLCLRITKYLVKEAENVCGYGSPCCHRLIDVLYRFEELPRWLESNEKELHIDPDEPLFPEQEIEDEIPTEDLLSNNVCKTLVFTPSHHTSYSNTDANDEKLIANILSKQSKPSYQKMLSYRQSLPAWNSISDILYSLSKNQVIVISGETGCGKTTQVPQFILDDWLLSESSRKDGIRRHVEIICTQPRRLSTIGVAERVAEERVEKIGESVGYQIRLESISSSLTRLLFCTTGILLRKLSNDPYMDRVTHVIVDEVHERNEESDFLLLILKELLSVRKDLKVILMSATMNAQLFSSYFGNVPLINIPGKTFPVTQIFLEDILEQCDYTLDEYSKNTRKVGKVMSRDMESLEIDLGLASSKTASSYSSNDAADENLTARQLFRRYSAFSVKTRKTLLLLDTKIIDLELVLSVLTWIVQGNHKYPRKGSILVFLPGLAEIMSLHDELESHPLFSPRYQPYVLIPLHSSISNEEQAAVFRSTKEGVRKIILSTNIAETSITIDDCVFVIDTGKMKESWYDTTRNMSSLETVWVSRANALQRKGRAGRVLPGVCVHLYTHHRYKYQLLGQPVPEIQRAALDQVVLRIKTLTNFASKDIVDVLGNVMEPPPKTNILTAIERLQSVGALDKNSELTALGRHLSALPVDVRIGKLMLFGAIFCCLDSVLTIAACLSYKSPFISPFGKRDIADNIKRKEFTTFFSDHLTNLKAYQKWQQKLQNGRQAGKRYAQESFLSWKVLEMIGDIKYQFLELLHSIGFIPPDIRLERRRGYDRILQITGDQLNENGNNLPLLAAIICAALYPNLVKILTPQRQYAHSSSGAILQVTSCDDIKFKTRQDGYVYLHPSSVNHNILHFPSPYLVYQEKIKTNKIFIHDSSMATALPLVLFAGSDSDLKVEQYSGTFVISLDDGWILFSMSSNQDAEMLQHMRSELSKLLEKKIEDPQLNLLTHITGKKIISTIVYIISNTE